MKLILTSNGWKKNEKIKKKFLQIVKTPSNKKVVLITTSKKNSSEWKYVKYHLKELSKIGFKKENITIVSLKEKKVSRPENVDVIYVCGGNTFEYMKELRRLKLTRKIKKLAKKDVVYFGISAGSIIAGSRIDVVKIGEKKDKNVNLKNYSGLKLINFAVFPHYRKENEKEIRKFEREKKCKIVRIKESETLIA